MLFSIIIPAKNESKNIEHTIRSITDHFVRASLAYEILVVDDGSTDDTAQRVCNFVEEREAGHVRLVTNEGPFGIGNAIKKGLQKYKGDAVIIAMADLSDDPEDMVSYAQTMLEGNYDCCFGDRWSQPNLVHNYPSHKLFINRFANWFIRIIFGMRYKDVTNAFKCYSRQTIDGIKPVLSHHFNITVELPLKAITRGFSYKIIPTKWYNRTHGISHLKIKEMGSRYLFIVLYIWLEKALCQKDYHKER